MLEPRAPSSNLVGIGPYSNTFFSFLQPQRVVLPPAAFAPLSSARCRPDPHTVQWRKVRPRSRYSQPRKPGLHRPPRPRRRRARGTSPRPASDRENQPNRRSRPPMPRRARKPRPRAAIRRSQYPLYRVDLLTITCQAPGGTSGPRSRVQSPMLNLARDDKPRSAALSRAAVTAPGLISIPRPRASGSSLRSARSRHPVPVPRSSTRKPRPLLAANCRAAATSASLSGRGSQSIRCNAKSEAPKLPAPQDTGYRLAPGPPRDQLFEAAYLWLAETSLGIADHLFDRLVQYVRQKQPAVTPGLRDAGLAQTLGCGGHGPSYVAPRQRGRGHWRSANLAA